MNIERIQLDFNKRKYDALEQSFSRMSQGSVITELEKYYNVRLFDRISQRLILTDTGRELLVTAKEILSGFESFLQISFTMSMFAISL